MIKVIEGEKYLNMHCTVCDTYCNIQRGSLQEDYTEINRFRGKHQHLDKLGKKGKGLQFFNPGPGLHTIRPLPGYPTPSFI